MLSNRRRVFVFGYAILLFFMAWALLADGTQTGTVVGTVFNADGAAVEAAVTLMGDRGERTQSSNAEGRFRFQSLDIGTYQAIATLPGLEGFVAKGSVKVSIGKTSELKLTLGREDVSTEPATVEDSIQVVAEALLVDHRSTRVGGNVPFEFIDELPVERFYQSAALLLPGVSGGEDGNPNVSGALRSNNLYLIDGVDTTDPTTGLFGLNLNYEAVKEVEVATGSIAPEYGRLSGAVINVVTRSGSNELEGTARWIATDRDTDGDYDRTDNAFGTLAEEIRVANSGSDGADGYLSLALGGRLVKDRLWFFAGYENPRSSFRRPVLEGSDSWDFDTNGENQAYKLTWNAHKNTSVVGQFTADALDQNSFQPFEDGPGMNSLPGVSQGDRGSAALNFIPGDIHAVEARSQDGDFTKLNLSTILNSKLSLSIAVADQSRSLRRRNSNARDPSLGAPHFDLDRGFVFNAITVEGEEERPREQANISASRFFQSGQWDQEVKLGVDYQKTKSIRDLNFPGIGGVDQDTQVPIAGQLYLDFDFRGPCLADSNQCAGFEVAADGSAIFQPFILWNFWARPFRETSQESAAFFISDEITLKRWFFNVGFRFEDIQGEDEVGRQLVDALTISPRIGFTYDLTNQGKTLIRGSYGRFYEPFLQKYVDFFDRGNIFSGFTEYLWGPTFLTEEGLDVLFGLNCSDDDPANPQSRCWLGSDLTELLGLASPVNPFNPLQIAPPNTELDPSYVDEFTIGFEHQLSDHVAVNLTYIHREWGDIWDDIFSIVPVLDSNGAVVRNDDGLFLFSDFTSTVANIADAQREYDAIQVLLQKRFSRNWQLLGSYTWSETKGNIFTNDGFDEFGDFSDLAGLNDPAFTALVNEDLANRFGLAPYDREHQVKLFANYRVPFERLQVSIGTALRYESGLPFQREVDGNLTARRLATERGSERLGDLFQWDLSLNTDFDLKQDFVFEIKAEIFNVTDDQEQIGVDTFDDGSLTSNFAQPRTIFDLQAPRSYRLTLGFRF